MLKRIWAGAVALTLVQGMLVQGMQVQGMQVQGMQVQGMLVQDTLVERAQIRPAHATPSLLPQISQEPSHASVSLNRAKWQPAGEGLQLAVLEGNLAQVDRSYSVLLKIADGAWIPPHWHPNDKRIAVLQGTLLMGQGDSLNRTAVRKHVVGDWMVVPARSRHYEGASGETILLLYGTGPLITNMVRAGNPGPR